MSSFKGLAWLKNFSRFELGSGLARLEVQNLSWARNKKLDMSQARPWLELKKLCFVLPGPVLAHLISLGGAGFTIARTTTKASVCICERKTS